MTYGCLKKVKTKGKNWVYKDLCQLSNLIKYLKKVGPGICHCSGVCKFCLTTIFFGPGNVWRIRAFLQKQKHFFAIYLLTNIFLSEF